MIYDFGCQSVADVTDAVMRILSAARGAVACLAVLAGLAVLGRAIRRGFGDASDSPSRDIFFGWSLVTVLLTFLVVFFTAPLALASYGVLAAMLLALVPAWKDKYFVTPFWLLAFSVGLIVLLAINLYGIGKWDDFSHWIPNAFYAYRFDGVPGKNLPPPHSAWPGYPYTVPFLTYLASRFAGGFVVTGGAMMSFLMLMVFAGLLLEIYQAPSRQSRISLRSVGWAAFGLLAVTLLNPNFNASFTMTSQADASTMVVAAALGLFLWQYIDAVKGGDRAAQRNVFLGAMVLAVLLTLIKQVNIALLGLLLIGFVAAGWKNKILKPSLMMSMPVLVISMLLRCLWQYHVDTEIAGNGFALKPLHAWRFDLLGPLLHAMGREALRKSGCFGLILISGIVGLVGLFRAPSRIGNFAIIAGTAACGYVVFLAVCYVGATFSEPEITRAASFFRYSTQVGLLTTSLVWIAAPVWGAWLLRHMKVPAFMCRDRTKNVACGVAILALPLCLVLSPVVLIATPNAMVCAARHDAQHIAEILPPATHLALFDPDGNGMFAEVLRFELFMGDHKPSRNISLDWNVTKPDLEQLQPRLQQLVGDKTINAVYAVRSQETPITLGGFDSQTQSLFLLRDGSGWRLAAP